MKVVAFLEPPQSDVIEDILKHCGLWQSSTAKGPPDVDGLVLELDAAYSDSFPPRIGHSPLVLGWLGTEKQITIIQFYAAKLNSGKNPLVKKAE